MDELNKNLSTVNNLTIKACTFTDLVYYYRVRDDLTHKEAKKKVEKICDFLNTDFGCSYRKDKPTGWDLYQSKYGKENANG